MQKVHWTVAFVTHQLTNYCFITRWLHLLDTLLCLITVDIISKMKQM